MKVYIKNTYRRKNIHIWLVFELKNIFVSTQGKQPQKGTREVIRIWLEGRPLNVAIVLIVCCDNTLFL